MIAQFGRALAHIFAGRVGRQSIRFAAVLVAIAFLVPACTEAPRPHGIQSANPDAAVPAVRHNSVVRGYLSQRPVEPGPWLEQNENVAPRPRR